MSIRAYLKLYHLMLIKQFTVKIGVVRDQIQVRMNAIKLITYFQLCDLRNEDHRERSIIGL